MTQCCILAWNISRIDAYQGFNLGKLAGFLLYNLRYVAMQIISQRIEILVIVVLLVA